MANVFINTDTTQAANNTPARLLANGDTLFLAQQATLAALGNTTTVPGAVGISTGTGANSTRITINGDLYSATANGIYAGSANQRIDIGATGSITANGNGAYGILLGADALGTSATVRNAGVVQSNNDAIAIKVGSLDLTNSGQLLSSSDGVFSEQGGTFVNSGLISGGDSGIVIDSSSSNVRNSGQIIGGGHGVFSTDGGTFVNSGQISAVTGIGLECRASSDVTNSGQIVGADEGIRIGFGAAQIVNDGLIQSQGAAIVLLDDTDSGIHSIVNNGTISGVAAGIEITGLEGVNTASVELTNTGTLAAAYAYDGSDGDDTIVNSGTIAGIVRLNAGNDAIDSSHGLVAGSVLGGLGDDTLIGSEGIDRLFGEDDNDSLTGNGGADRLDGGFGIDTMDGGAGNDVFWVDDAADQTIEAIGDGGRDTVYATVSYTLAAGEEIEVLRGVEVAPPAAAAAFVLTGLVLTGNEFANSIYGTNDDDDFNGKEANDTLNGLGGADLMRGAEGNDRFYVDDAGDEVEEVAEQGVDRVLASADYTLQATMEIEQLTTTLSSGTDAIDLTGNEIANWMIGNNGVNTLNGKGGADTMTGLGGSDFYWVDNALDRTIEVVNGGTADRVYAAVNYTLGAGQQIEQLVTTSSSTTTALNLTGNEIKNTITGNNGNNILAGGLGNDVLSGLGGQDAFLFNTALGATNVDTISGFVVADDTIQIDDDIFSPLSSGPGTLSQANFHIGAAAADSEDRIIYNSATGALIFDSNGNGAGGATQFATLSAGLALTNADFLVVA